jgi:hypothetical protein
VRRPEEGGPLGAPGARAARRAGGIAEELEHGQILPAQADTQIVAKKRQGDDPVARLHERARWSSFTNVWNGSAAPGGAPRWVRRMIIAAFVVMAVVGLVVGLIGLLTHYW